MSYFTPAALNAASRAGRSAVSQRTDDFVSGRMTPILPAFDDELPPPPAELPPLSLEPQALSERAAPMAPTSTKLCIRFTRTASLRVGPSRVDSVRPPCWRAEDTVGSVCCPRQHIEVTPITSSTPRGWFPNC